MEKMNACRTATKTSNPTRTTASGNEISAKGQVSGGERQGERAGEQRREVGVVDVPEEANAVACPDGGESVLQPLRLPAALNVARTAPPRRAERRRTALPRALAPSADPSQAVRRLARAPNSARTRRAGECHGDR